MNTHYCVIMAGGIGSRFWPLSTQTKPKQFLDILGTGKTLLQQTYDRMKKVIDPENILIVTNKQYKELVAEQLPELAEENILLEPSRRNTAPCICYSTFVIKKRSPRATIITCPSDHLISNEEEFYNQLNIALDTASQHNILMTMGIQPSRPETGYGYIQFKESKLDAHEDVKTVKTFTEKPNAEIAQQFLDSGDFLWNAGIFIWNADAIMNSFEKFLPEMYSTFESGWNDYGTENEVKFIDKTYPTVENESVDFGILEKAKNVYVIPGRFDWSDLGTWGSVGREIEGDANGNALFSKKLVLHEAKNNTIRISKDKAAVIVGLNDYIVIDNDNKLLICPTDKEQLIKQFVNDLRMEFGEDYI